MTRLVFLALLLCCVSVSADEPEPAVGSEVLLIDAQRYFVIDIGGDAPTIREITDVWVTGTTPGNPPTPPPPTKTLRQQLEEITAAVNDPLIEKALSEGVYATLKERLQAGTMTWQQCLSGIKLATDMVVGQSDKKPVWATWRTQFGAIIDKAQSEGQLTTKAQQVSFLGDVESVLSESSKNAAINFEMLLRLIRLILDLINTFFPQPPKAIEQPADPPPGISSDQIRAAVEEIASYANKESHRKLFEALYLSAADAVTSGELTMDDAWSRIREIRGLIGNDVTRWDSVFDLADVADDLDQVSSGLGGSESIDTRVVNIIGLAMDEPVFTDKRKLKTIVELMLVIFDAFSETVRVSPAAQKTGAIQPPVPSQPAVERKPVYTPARPIRTTFDADEARFGLVP